MGHFAVDCRSRYITVLRFSVMLVLPSLLLTGSGQAQPSSTQSSTLIADRIKAQELLNAAIDRIGGAERLRKITSIHYVLQTEFFNGVQGYDASDIGNSAKDTDESVLTLDFDFAGHRFRRSSAQRLTGGIHLDVDTYFLDGQVSTVFTGTHRFTRTSGTEGTLTDFMGRYSSVLFAKRALENLSSATYIGARIENAERVDVVELSWDAKTRMRAHLSNDHKIVALEAVGIDPLAGDVDVLYTFPHERVVDGLRIADEIKVTRGKQKYLTAKVSEIVINPVFNAGTFDVPNGEVPQTEKSVNALGNGVYEIVALNGGTFRVIFVDLGDGVAVFDAPESRRRSQWVVSEIHKALGDKPIKYLVVSHFHDDHVAGIGYYSELGTKIITVRKNAAAIARYARVNSAFNPDLPAGKRVPNFLFMDNDKLELLGSGLKRLEIFKLRDCPHAKDMLVAYEPSSKTLVEADLLVELAAYNPTSFAFSKWLATNSAPNVEWIVGTHQAKIPRTQLNEAAKAFENSLTQREGAQ